MTDLKLLKQQMLEHCVRQANRGGNVSTWECPSCNRDNNTTLPTENGVIWTSTTTCYECGKISSVVKTINQVTLKNI